jgi:hypothetical protein
MTPMNPPVSARRNVPMMAILIVAALLAVGFAFAWPW